METRNKKLPPDSVVPLGTALSVLLSAHLGFAQEEAPLASALVVHEANRPFRYAAQGAVDLEAEVIAIAMARPPTRVRTSCDLPSAPSDHLGAEEMAM
jgi:hypothetical protein